MIELPEMPPTIAALPRDSRGYPTPAFVATVNGEREFRVADGRFMAKAMREHLCWVCGTKLDLKKSVFVLGPMCICNRVSSEPPCHQECAEFSAKACPFLSMPKAVRREANFPEGTVVAGMQIKRNPGVCCLWFCNGYEPFYDGNGGVLFRIANPSMVRWYSEGRKATREEILESINSGLPILQAEARSASAKQQLEWSVTAAMKLVPKA